MADTEVIDITLPVTRAELAALKLGDQVRLFGPVYTMRDAGHLRVLEQLEQQSELPYNLAGQTLFYAGPAPATAGFPSGAVGPTTASRMDFAAPRLFKAGIVAVIGKGARSDEVAQACRETGSVCFSAVGGAAAFLGSKVMASELIAWEDLGTEALRKLELNGLPVFVTVDSKGNQMGSAPNVTKVAMGSAPNVTTVEMGESLIDTTPATGNRGAFITFEGGEGVGKSTQIRLLSARLEAAGIEVLCLREPGGTAIGESIRSILLDPKNTRLTSMSELLLYEASRAQLTEEVIAPALKRGVTVLCDRYIDSTTAYQGYARGLDLDLIARANHLGSNGLVPDRTIVLELDVNLSLGKAIKDGADRLESEGLEFHTLVHQGFAQIAIKEPERVRRVQCQDLKQDTAQAVFDQVVDLFPQARQGGFTYTPELLHRRDAADREKPAE